MAYRAGIDLGTTFTAAAIQRDGEAKPEVVTLGSRGASIPTVVFVDVDGAVLVGETAEARSSSDPARVAREFKRRLGDPTPILVGGSPWSPEALLAEVLRHVVGRITAEEGGPPSALTLTYPANWGPYKVEQFRQVPTLAHLPCPTDFTTEPDAAAAHYASIARTPAGAVVAVYDLGGGTFDATVLRVGDDGRPIRLGTAEGIDRLGGVDVDAAVLEHVRANAAHLFEGLDADDPLVASSLAQLRDACRRAKEVLSEDTHATVVVALPTGAAQVRMTRDELETAIAPQVKLTVAALQRAMGSAGVTPEQVDVVLLVGGASRMPIVAQSVSAALGRPTAVDANPKHATALGAALGPAPAPAPAPAAEAAPAPAASDASPTPRPAAPPTADDGNGNGNGAASGRRRPLLVVGAVLLVAAAVGGYLAFGQGESQEPLTVGTIAGTGDFGDDGDHGPAVDAQLQSPVGLTIDPDGRILVADEGSDRIRAISQDGVISPVVEEVSLVPDDGGGAVSVAPLVGPSAVAAHADGRIVFLDSDCYVGEIATDGTATLIAGTYPDPDFLCEDNELGTPVAIAAHPDGRTLVLDQNGGQLLAIADDEEHTVELATPRTFDFPTAVAMHPDGRILVADEGGASVVAVLEDDTTRTLAGTGEFLEEGTTDDGDGGPATEAVLGFTSAIAVDGDGRLLIADTETDRIRVVDDDGIISTLAGTGTAGFNGDGLDPARTQLFGPQALVVGDDGEILVADRGNARVRSIR